MKLAIYIILLLIATILLFFYWGYRENQHLVITRYSLGSKKLPKAFDGCKIAFLSDLHNNEFGEKNKKLKEAMLRENPDMVLIGGDMLIGQENASYEVALELILWIQDHFPMVYAMGNHEYRLKENPTLYGSLYRDYAKKLKKKGIHILDNETKYWKRDGEKIAIYGLTISQFYYKRLKIEKMRGTYITSCLGRHRDVFSILLAHNPVHFPAYAEWGADLVLSGHNHGGVARLPFLGGVVSPNYRLFPKYDVGKFHQDHSTMLISAGLGSHTLPFRFFNPPELLIIQLHFEE